MKTEEELPDFDDIEEEHQVKTEEVVEEKTEETQMKKKRLRTSTAKKNR